MVCLVGTHFFTTHRPNSLKVGLVKVFQSVLILYLSRILKKVLADSYRSAYRLTAT